jgi:hypothetical protein
LAGADAVTTSTDTTVTFAVEADRRLSHVAAVARDANTSIATARIVRIGLVM